MTNKEKFLSIVSHEDTSTLANAIARNAARNKIYTNEEKAQAKDALKIAFFSNVFAKEFTDKWTICKGIATQKEDAEAIVKLYKAQNYFAKSKTIYFDGTPRTFWIAIRPK